MSGNQKAAGSLSNPVLMERIERRQLFSGDIPQALSPVLPPQSSSLSSALTPVLRSTMDSSLPAPTISSPGSGATPGPVLSTLSPTFTWTAVTGVSSMTGYQLNLYDSTSAQFTSYQISASATSYTLPSGLTAGHSYIWNLRITATESSGAVTGHESNYLYFQAPPPVTLPVPVVIGPGSPTSPGPVLTTLTPTFTWNAVTGNITGYQINLYDSTTSVFKSFQVGASATSFTLPSGDLNYGDHYVWNLRTLNGSQSGGPSTYLYFQGPAAPAPAPTLPVPTITSPGNATSPGPLLSTDNPTFTWNAVTGITGYQLNIHDNTSNKSYSYTIGASATSFTPTAGTLTAGDSFVWNLRVLNGTQSGSPSTYFYFQTPTPTPAPTLPVPTITSPGNATSPGPLLSTDNPTFTWNAVTGITGYQLNINDNTSNKFYSYTVGSSATSFTPPAGTLTAGDKFVWNLRVLNGTQSGSPSTYFYFQTPAPVALPVPTITSPGNATSPGPVLSTDNPTFTWNAVAGITGYQLNLHDNTTNKSYSYTVGASATSFTPPTGTLAAGDSFVWNLRVLNGTQSGAPSTYFYFQTPAATPAPTLPKPTISSPGSAIPPGPLLTVANPTFSWNAVTGITGYQLNVFDTTTNKSYSFTVSPTATSFTAPTGTFTLGDDFVWNLRVLNGSASGSPSTYFYFELPPSSPSTKLQTKIVTYTDKLAHLDSEMHTLAKSLDAATPNTGAHAQLERSYKSTTKEVKSIEAERAALETELDEMT